MYVDTGAMYRAMTLKVLEHNIDVHDERAIAQLTSSTEICFERCNDDLRVILDNRDVTQKIRSQAVTRAVSAISAVKEVRDLMVREQRKMSSQGDIVVEGRDIGTVVFPQADVKIYMVADARQRALRRQKELRQQGVDVDVIDLEKDIQERDRKDSGRGISPLRKAADAVELDTSHLSIEEQVDFIIREVEKVRHLRS